MSQTSEESPIRVLRSSYVKKSDASFLQACQCSSASSILARKIVARAD